MGHQLPPWRLESWRSEHGQNLWLSRLIEAMEEVSRAEYRALPCDPSVLAALNAQLARADSRYAHLTSRLSLPN
jgi:hypothetical protein